MLSVHHIYAVPMEAEGAGSSVMNRHAWYWELTRPRSSTRAVLLTAALNLADSTLTHCEKYNSTVFSIPTVVQSHTQSVLFVGVCFLERGTVQTSSCIAPAVLELSISEAGLQLLVPPA